MANTTSGTTTFDKTFAIDEIIEDAFERIGLNSNNGKTCKTVRLNKVRFNVSVTAPADAIRMQWDADTDVVFQTLAGEMEYDYSSFGGLKNTEATGFTGDVNVVLPACSDGDSATIVCEWIKVYES